MGSLLCCFRVDDFEEASHANLPIFRYCICLRCLTQQLVQAYIVLFQRGEVRAVHSSLQGTIPLTSAATAEDNSLLNTYRSPPRPLPYDDPRCSRQRDGVISRRGKCSSHSHEESELLRRSCDGSDVETTSNKEKQGGSEYGVKLCGSDSSLKHSTVDASCGSTYYFSSSEDEDMCPTCLEEYTSENPKISMQCAHHFHLSCIYEWMERSEACPVCGKVMAFDESK